MTNPGFLSKKDVLGEIDARVHYLGVNRREFVSAVIPKNNVVNSELKIHGETLEYLDHKIFNTHIKRD